MESKLPKHLKKILNFGPAAVFLILSLFFGLVEATTALVVMTNIGLAVTYYYERKFPQKDLYTAIIINIFGLATIFTGNSAYIKIKPTVFYLLLAIILFGGLAANKALMKPILGGAIKMHEHAWKIFTRRWAYFFIFLALLNEIVWRNFSESTWVMFKVFGIIILLFIFMMTQVSFVNKHKPE